MNRRTFIKQSALIFVLANTPVAIGSAMQRDSNRSGSQAHDSHIKDRLVKKRHFNQTYTADIFLEKKDLPVLDLSIKRLKRIERLVGFGNFCLLNFDDAINISKSYSRIGLFTKQELDFFETIFYFKGQQYGFMGEKPIKSITGRIIKKKVKKIPYTGNYLYQGKPIERYNRIKEAIGDQVVLTSGVRSVMKQFLLFLNKTKSSNGNLSMASRSLAPPGYSFHGVGDFDVGQKGYGIHNFTERFTQTEVYQKLVRLGYIKFRYDKDNDLGVLFEPWHIEVT